MAKLCCLCRHHRCSVTRRASIGAAKWLAVFVLLTPVLVPNTAKLFSQDPVPVSPSDQRTDEGQGRNVEEIPRPPSEGLVAVGLTLAELEQMSMVANPSVARAAAELEVARGRWIQVGLPPNLQAGWTGQQIGSRGLAEQYGVQVEQEIVRGGKLRLNREVAAQEWARAEHSLAVQQQRVLTDVRLAFYGVLASQRALELRQELLGIDKQSLDAAQALLKANEVARTDVLQARIEFESTQLLLTNAQNRLGASWRTLASVVGHADLIDQPLAGELESDMPEFEWQSTLDRLLGTSPEIAVAMADVERARWALQRARAEPTPNLNVQGLVNYIDNGIGGSSDGALQVMVPLPILNRNQGGITAAYGEVAAAERALQQVEFDLQNRLAPVFERYLNSRNQVNRYREILLPTAEESLKLTRQAYRGGEISFVALLTAQRTFSQTKVNYLDSLLEFRQAEVEIEGLLLSESLRTR